ncbi:glycogen debranching protein GlgX [Pseudobutyrivibrio sp. MD2005]|uniref:glycogen debranching protein GlgX n=1 Tax=Pseudobutyrivibrio sp. MD2005 TaxID=1410616 RepID=UPI0004804934|nr:glycogen debranching protein GlgX [Pseudobutyrivibrio sp. MD2005]
MKLIDSFPTNKIGDLEYRMGRVFPFGASIVDDGVNFSVYSKEATSCSLVLFHHGHNKPFVEINIPKEFKIGNVYTIMVFGINIETTEYGYRFDGEFDPKQGLWFDKSKVVLDPYAKSVSGLSIWGKNPGKRQFRHRGQIIREDYDWEGDVWLDIPQQDLCIYEMHVRSFTMKDKSIKYKGTFYGLTEKIPYLKELGINCIELMPIFAFDEFENSRKINGKTLYNYWGYSTVGFFAPKAGYAASAPFGMEADELKNMIKHLHKNGIEVILDVVFNHTAEGNENGPYISYRGIDNRTYYMLTPDGAYYNFSGCGNTFNGNNAVVRTMILDCLRYWVSSYHIDGFRFDLASILTRDMSGAPMYSPPLLELLANDSVLGKTKLIAEAWDAGGLYQVGNFPSWNRFAEWNGKYRDCVRRFIKGDADAAIELYWRIGGSKDMYQERSSDASINFITCHDGFTLYDIFAYNEKHNEANGEDNRDGSNDNNSWNCGVEGETEDKSINDLRLRQMKNAFTILMTSRGIPMFLAGDEIANTQYGNNNAYCQDNDVSWIDWKRLKLYGNLFEYVKHLIELRKAHPVLRNKDFDEAQNGTGYPELSFHGENPWAFDIVCPKLVMGYMFAEDHIKYGTAKDAFIYIGLNAHWEEHRINLPIIPGSMKWHLAADSYTGETFGEGQEKLYDKDYIELAPRSSMILIGQ